MHYVIGDVHGCYDEMMALLHRIEKEDADARIIFVGDFVDRGPQVDKVLEWCLKNITVDGKYQSVRGNHEQMVLEWYEEWLSWWDEGGFQHPRKELMPETYYDFSKWMDGMNLLTPEKLEPYMEFIKSLPYNKALEVESLWGKKNTFRIVHSFYEYEEVSEEEQQHSNLWKRIEYGNLGSTEILVHGHTPTLNMDYIYWGVKDTKPGMVSYRLNDINVDGGCVFAKGFPMYPAMLCAIRLEDLEEIYAYSAEERFLQGAEEPIVETYQRERARLYREKYLQKESAHRQRLLKKLGNPEYEHIPDGEIVIPETVKYEVGEMVVFRVGEEEYTGVIDAVHLFGSMDYQGQPCYDIEVELEEEYRLYKSVPEMNIVK